MAEFLHLLMQFPTLLFAGLLAISLFYWGLVIVGAADLNPFHGAHAVGGIEGAVKGGVEGAVKGAVHAVAHASDADAVKANTLTEALAFLGLTKVPITISFSLFSLFAWFISLATRQALDPHLGEVASAAAATAVAVVGGLVATSLVTKPIAGLFTESQRTAANVSLVGRVARVTTEVADDVRGQAEIDDGAGGITIAIRLDKGSFAKRGDEVIIIEHDEKAGVYNAAPQQSIVQTEAEALAAPVELAAKL